MSLLGLTCVYDFLSQALQALHVPSPLWIETKMRQPSHGGQSRRREIARDLPGPLYSRKHRTHGMINQFSRAREETPRRGTSWYLAPPVLGGALQYAEAIIQTVTQFTCSTKELSAQT